MRDVQTFLLEVFSLRIFQTYAKEAREIVRCIVLQKGHTLRVMSI